MTVGSGIRVFGTAVLLAGALVGAGSAPTALAEGCPQNQVVFARGSGQPVGLGDVGQAFIDALREQLPGQSIDDYAVNYPASHDYRNSSLDGEKDAVAHIQTMVANCPNTKLVMGGYSQGAMVMEMSSNSLPPQVADHVAAVALFGAPVGPYSSSLMGGSLPELAPAYRAKAIDLCIPQDIYCTESGSVIPHLQYIPTGMTDQAATFVAGKLK
ncbi:MAG TPA: cutinase family protein [Mycobacterium sp.]|nr:cutinase family protein [Mycobacterium sp.]